jgi:hypothetical protein
VFAIIVTDDEMIWDSNKKSRSKKEVVKVFNSGILSGNIENSISNEKSDLSISKVNLVLIGKISL